VSIIVIGTYSRLSGNDSASIDVDRLSTDEAPIRTRQEHIRRAEFARLADPSNGRRRAVPLLHLLVIHRGWLERGPNGTGADGVDADPLGDELIGEAADHGDLRAFGHAVVEEHRGSGVCHWVDEDQSSRGCMRRRTYLGKR